MWINDINWNDNNQEILDQLSINISNQSPILDIVESKKTEIKKEKLKQEEKDKKKIEEVRVSLKKWNNDSDTIEINWKVITKEEFNNIDFSQYILEDGRINVTPEVIYKIANFWEEIWLSDKNPVSIILKEITKNYIHEHPTNIEWLQMNFEFLKWDYENKVYWAGPNNQEKIPDDLMNIEEKLFHNFAWIYWEILWKIFWPDIQEKMDSLYWWITNELKTNIKRSYIRFDMLNIFSWLPWAISVISQIDESTNNMDKLMEYIWYFNKNNIKWSKLWVLFKEYDKNCYKLMDFIDWENSTSIQFWWEMKSSAENWEKQDDKISKKIVWKIKKIFSRK